MTEPQVSAKDLDDQISEMLGGMDKVEGREPPPEPSGPQAAPPETSTPTPAAEPKVEAEPAKAEDRLAAAIATIDNLTRQVGELQMRVPQPTAASTPTRPEPSIEFDEVLGRRVPKDRSRRAIKLQAEDLHRLGWNDDPAKVIEDLGNAFLDFIVELLPNVTTQGWEARTRAERETKARFDSFWGDHQDLKDMEPFVATVEQMSRQDGSLLAERDFTVQQYGSFDAAQRAYGAALGRKVREKVAAMRGLTIDQYLAAVQTPAPAPRGGSRAITTGGGGSPSRTPGQPARGSQQAEIDDMIDNR